MPEAPETETIGERVRRLRHERGLSQRELSGPGVTYAYISRVEAGARNPSVKALRLLAEKLGVTADYLERGTDVRGSELRELRLTELELRIRLDDDVALDELEEILAEATARADGPATARARIALGLAAANRSSSSVSSPSCRSSRRTTKGCACGSRRTSASR
jgi:transcriptional regulator with XRE-family HTH domain